jgi:predicted enzyme related to lactoylglutathione lyase
MSSHFGFTKLVVGDLEKSAAFYESVAGLTRQTRIEAVIGGRAITEIVYEATARGGASLVLLSYQDTPTPAAGEIIVGFVTPDADAWMARAEAAGATIVEAPSDRAAIGLRVAFAKDPEGHLIEVIQPLK